MDYLANLNHHPRDDFITFDEGPHIYTVHGDSSFTSVTTFIHSNFSHFDSNTTVDKILSGSKWMNEPSYKYYQKTKQEILQMWEDKRDSAAKAGTKLHYDIECYYNNCSNENNSIEYQYFNNFVKDFPDLKPFRTEWMVYYEEYKLSGSIDMIFENEDGTLQIYDWKRSKEISKTNSWNKYAITECIDYLPDCNYWHYCLQLNIYKYILEKKYNKKVTDLYLVCLHPDNRNKNFERIKVTPLDDELVKLFELRMINM